jgi:hypothetical protein
MEPDAAEWDDDRETVGALAVPSGEWQNCALEEARQKSVIFNRLIKWHRS